MKLSLIAMCAAIGTVSFFLYSGQSSEAAVETVSNTFKQISVLQTLQATAKKITHFTIATCKDHPVYTSFGVVTLALSIACIVSPSFRCMLKRCLGFDSSESDVLEKIIPEVQASNSIEDSIAEHIVPAHSTQR